MKKEVKDIFFRKQTFIPPVCKIVTLPETKDVGLYKGVRVKEGQCLTREGIYPSVHTSIPGVITQIYLTTHAFGHAIEVIEIALEGRFDFNKEEDIQQDWQALPVDACIRLLETSGIVDIPEKTGVDTVLINACEEEMGLRHNSSLFSEQYQQIIEYAPLILYLFRARQIHLCIDTSIRYLKNTVERCIQKQHNNALAVKVIPRYQGFMYCNDALLMEYCKVTAQSAQVVSVESILHIIEAVLYRRPVRKQTVYIHGNALKEDVFVYAHIGAPLFQLVSDFIVDANVDTRIILNGMLTGIEITTLDYPLDSSIHSIAIDLREKPEKELPCTACGACTAVCPAHLEPQLLYKLIRSDNKQSLKELSIDSCISCGLCSYVCPSRIPLSHQIIQNRKHQQHTRKGFEGSIHA